MSHGLRSSYDDSPRSCGPIVLPDGIIQVRLRNGIRLNRKFIFDDKLFSLFLWTFRVYLTLDKSIRLTNSRSRITLSLSSNGGSAALIHPNGKVYQFGSFVEIVAYDGNETNNYVYVWEKFIVFQSNIIFIGSKIILSVSTSFQAIRKNVA